MKILIQALNYPPEFISTGKYTGEMAEWLAARGHEVSVITTPPYYPQWQVWQEYSAFAYRRETIQNVKVIRCPLWVPTKLSGLKRILHLLSFVVWVHWRRVLANRQTTPRCSHSHSTLSIRRALGTFSFATEQK
jgi:glycosyltransferase involved in cell wall biosynthesis